MPSRCNGHYRKIFPKFHLQKQSLQELNLEMYMVFREMMLNQVYHCVLFNNFNYYSFFFLWRPALLLLHKSRSMATQSSGFSSHACGARPGSPEASSTAGSHKKVRRAEGTWSGGGGAEQASPCCWGAARGPAVSSPDPAPNLGTPPQGALLQGQVLLLQQLLPPEASSSKGSQPRSKASRTKLYNTDSSLRGHRRSLRAGLSGPTGQPAPCPLPSLGTQAPRAPCSRQPSRGTRAAA